MMNHTNSKDSKKKRTTGLPSSGSSRRTARGNNSSKSTSSATIPTQLVGVTNLKPKCDRIFRLILANPAHHDVIKYEKELWNEIKQFRHGNDTMLLNYLVGYYISLLESLLIWPSRKDPYLLEPTHKNLPPAAKSLVYNTLIHIGDLNRYLGNLTLAENYYQNAVKMNVMRGHAYNQLAIATPLNQPFRCIYYSARASKASEEPTLVAESNLNMAVKRFNKNILKKIFKIELSEESKTDNDDLPQQAIDWFYLAVICVYADNFEPIVKPLFTYILNVPIDNSSDCLDLEFALMGFDVIMDWVDIKDCKKQFAEDYTKELKDLKMKMNEANDENLQVKLNEPKALFHDYILRGFSPLQRIQETLTFDCEEPPQINTNSLLSRISFKIEKLFGKVLKPKKIRNVALKSILENF